MRIIAGRLGGRGFDSPRSAKTHPMSDKIRGALFNMLGDIDGLRVLDAFGGSGALGFEALSRGATTVVTIESDRLAQKTIRSNTRTLGLSSRLTLIAASAGAWLATTNDQFDIVMCDPPFADLQPNLIARLSTRVIPDGLLVLSWPASERPLTLDGWNQVLQRHYGDAQLIIYRKS